MTDLNANPKQISNIRTHRRLQSDIRSNWQLWQIPLNPRKLHPRHAPREARLAHLLEHFLHLRVLAQQIVDFLHTGAGAAGDAFAAAAVDGFMMVALVARSWN